jgi:exodeoxyribonuclease VII small subunit
MTDSKRRSGPGPEEPLALEARLARLEEILGQLEADEVELERALALFEEGVRLVRNAERELSETALRVEELLEDGGTAPLDEGSDG